MSFYSPSEDSYLLCGVVKSYLKNKENISKLTVFDLGTGSGIQSKNLITLGIKKENIVASDVNNYALKEAKKIGVEVIKSNLFSKITKKYDLIIFNPPYLPEDKYDKEIDITGGKKGDEIIVNFFKELKNYLNKKGIVFLLTSSLTPENWKKIAEKQKFKVKKIAEKHLFFEKLFVWIISLQ